MNDETDIVLQDRYGSYKSSPPMPKVPSFPCPLDQSCTPETRKCDAHKRVLFVKNMTTTEIFEIPYGNWENWLWYKERISDFTGIPLHEIRVIYAGCERDGIQRHSGLQSQSTILMIRRQSDAQHK